MFHRYKTSFRQKFLKNSLVRAYVWCISVSVLFRFQRLQKHHKIAITVSSIGIFLVSSLIIMTSFSRDSALAQIRFKIAIRATPAPLTGICYPLVNTATVGQTVDWIVSPDNGTPPYTYNWSGSEGANGSTSFIQKIYTSTGTKTATVIIASGEQSSLPISCMSSVIITAPSGGGGGGGGSNSGNDTPAPSKKDPPPILDSAPSEDIKIDIPQKDIPREHPDCPFSENPTFGDAKDYLVCDGLITQREKDEEYEYGRNTYRKELLGIATTIHLKDSSAEQKIQLSRLSSNGINTPESSSFSSYYFLDIGIPGQPEWVSQTVKAGITFGLISTKNTHFRPDDTASRAESFAMLMKSVCMDPDQSAQKNWQQRVYEIALHNGVTSRSWGDFRPDAPILRQELFLITARLDRWKDETGGCDTYTHLTQKYNEIPILESAPNEGEKTPQTEVTNTQKSGTFALLYENETEKVYTYIIKSGGTPDGVRAQYLRVFSRSKARALRLKIHDIAGVEYPEERWLLGGEIVYVTFTK